MHYVEADRHLGEAVGEETQVPDPFSIGNHAFGHDLKEAMFHSFATIEERREQRRKELSGEAAELLVRKKYLSLDYFD